MRFWIDIAEPVFDAMRAAAIQSLPTPRFGRRGACRTPWKCREWHANIAPGQIRKPLSWSPGIATQRFGAVTACNVAAIANRRANSPAAQQGRACTDIHIGHPMRAVAGGPHRRAWPQTGWIQQQDPDARR